VAIGKKDPPGRIRPGRPFIAICLVRVGDVADVDLALVHRAPHPAARIPANVEVAVMPVVAVTVVVMAVVVVAVVVMAVMAMTMTAAVAAAAVPGRRIARGGEGRNRQRDGSGSGGEDGTLHFNFSWGFSRATIALACDLLVP
jgi:hypothetical protein